MLEVEPECFLARERGRMGPLRDWLEVVLVGGMFGKSDCIGKKKWVGVGCRREEAGTASSCFCSREVNLSVVKVSRKEQKVTGPGRSVLSEGNLSVSRSVAPTLSHKGLRRRIYDEMVQ